MTQNSFASTHRLTTPAPDVREFKHAFNLLKWLMCRVS